MTTFFASGFEKTGIWPCILSLVLNTITKPQSTELEKDSQLLKTPMTRRAVRRIQKAYEKNHPLSQRWLLGMKRKKSQGGKRLNILGEEDAGP